MRLDSARWTEKSRSQIGEDRLRAFIRHDGAQAEKTPKRQSEYMKNPQQIQSGPIVPALLSLEPGAVNTELLPIVGANKIGWTGENQVTLVEAVIPHLKDAEGNSPNLTEEFMDRIRLVYRPTEEIQRRVLIQTFLDAGYELDAGALAALVPLISVGQFAKWLSETNKPGTNKPYIVLERKRGAKKKMFDALIEAAPTPIDNTAEPTETDEESASDEEQQEPQIVQPKPVAKPATTKPATRK